MSVNSIRDIWYGEKNMTNAVTCNYATKEDLRGAIIDLKSFIQLTSNCWDKSNKVNEKKETKTMKASIPKIKNIDFQPPLTVVIWEDGTKTFVRCLEDDEFDPEKGAAMAIAKKFLGDTYHYNDVINYYTEKYYRKHPGTKRPLNLSVPEQDIIWLIRQCGEETEKFITDTLMEIYTGM